MKNLIVIFFLLIFGQNTNAQTTEHFSTESFFKTAKKNVIKFNLSSLLAGEHLELSYERFLNTRQSIQLGVGIIGIGVKRETLIAKYGTSNEEKIFRVSSGAFFNGGYRFYLKPLRKMSKPNIAKGFYAEPNVIFGGYKRNTKNKKQEDISFSAILLNAGYQILSKRFSLDIYAGVGFGTDNVPQSNEGQVLYFGEFHRGIYKTERGRSTAIRAGVRFGYAF